MYQHSGKGRAHDTHMCYLVLVLVTIGTPSSIRSPYSATVASFGDSSEPTRALSVGLSAWKTLACCHWLPLTGFLQ